MTPGVHTETRFDELKRYVGFSAVDADALRSFEPVASPHFKRIADEFYAQLRQHEEAHAVFTAEAQIVRLQRSLVRWMERLFAGCYNEDYFDSIATIGRVHVKVGLPQRYMLTAMALVRVSLMQIVEAHGPPQASQTAPALSRLLDLELAIMLESYREDYVARIQRVERVERAILSASLARIEHRYVNAVKLARVIIVGLDAGGNVRLWNREAERITGFARDEILGRPISEALGMDEQCDAQPLHDVLAALPGGNPTGPLETMIHTRAGHTRLLSWQFTHAPDETDEVCVFAVASDITDERAALARTRQQERLAAIGTLAAGLAHEIRNPLNGAQLHVTFLARALKHQHADADLIDAVRVVGDEISRLGTLVTEFLAFARPVPLSMRLLAVRPLLERIVDIISPQAESHRVAVELDLPGVPLELTADGAKLEQVLLNLGQNAIEAVASADAGGRVILRARRHTRIIMIEVEDDGPGIPHESPIFDAFFSTKPQGTGLGLSISHRIATDHGGALDVESRPGRTVFRLQLPIDGPLSIASLPALEVA